MKYLVLFLLVILAIILVYTFVFKMKEKYTAVSSNILPCACKGYYRCHCDK